MSPSGNHLRTWLAVLRPENWDVLQQRGFDVLGLSSQREKTVRTKVRPGDRIVVYVSDRKKFLGVLEVTAATFRSDKRIWLSGTYPVRIPTRPLLILPLSAGLSAAVSVEHLSFISNKQRWGSVFFRSLIELPGRDARFLIERISKLAQPRADAPPQHQRPTVQT